MLIETGNGLIVIGEATIRGTAADGIELAIDGQSMATLIDKHVGPRPGRVRVTIEKLDD